MTNYLITYSVVATNGKTYRKTFSRYGYSAGEVVDDFLSWVSHKKIVIPVGSAISIYCAETGTETFSYDEDFAESFR